MLIDPKARSILQEQVSRIQHAMMKEAIMRCKFSEGTEEEIRQRFDIIMKIYNEYTDALLHDVLLPLDSPTNQVVLRSVEFAILVKRLNKGYAHFVYDISPYRLQKRIDEEIAKQNLNNIEEEPNDTPLPESNQEGDN